MTQTILDLLNQGASLFGSYKKGRMANNCDPQCCPDSDLNQTLRLPIEEIPKDALLDYYFYGPNHIGETSDYKCFLPILAKHLVIDTWDPAPLSEVATRNQDEFTAGETIWLIQFFQELGKIRNRKLCMKTVDRLKSRDLVSFKSITKADSITAGYSLADLEQCGFALLKGAVTDSELTKLSDAIEPLRNTQNAAGIRNLLNQCPAIHSFASTGVGLQIAKDVLGKNVRAVRAILFDKTPDANWYVTWHQDLKIPVKNKIEVDGYTSWSTKDGVLHVQPPAIILENMVSIRVHLDDCLDDKGPIIFIAGSHRHGVLGPAEIEFYRNTERGLVCQAKRGDIIVMRPLTLHSSSIALNPERRRVLHIEYSSAELPNQLQWAEA